MELRVFCCGVPIGTFEVTACAGLAHAILSPDGGFEMARQEAELAGAALSIRHSPWRYWQSARVVARLAVSPAGGDDRRRPAA